MPRVAKLAALAIQFEQLIRDGVAADQAELARLGHMTRAGLTRNHEPAELGPGYSEADFVPAADRTMLRQIVAVADWGEQRRMWRSLGLQSPSKCFYPFRMQHFKLL